MAKKPLRQDQQSDKFDPSRARRLRIGFHVGRFWPEGSLVLVGDAPAPISEGEPLRLDAALVELLDRQSVTVPYRPA